MTITRLQTNILYAICFFLICMNNLHAQTQEVTLYYEEYIQKNEVSFEEKEQLVDSLLKVPNASVDSLKLAQLYYKFSAKDWKSNLKRSIFYADKAIAIANNLGTYDDEVFVKIHYNKTLFLVTDQQYYKALKNSDRYLQLYKKEDQRLGKLYRLRGDIYTDLGDFENAIANYDKSIYLLKKNEEDKDLLKTYINKLKTLIEMFVDATDQEHITKIQTVIKELDAIQEKYEANDSDKAAINLNKGVFYDLIRHKDKAIDFYTEALRINTMYDDSTNIAKNVINLGSVYKNNGELEEAKKQLLKAQKITKNLPFLSSMVFNNLADIYQKENNHEKAIIHYQNAITQALHSETLDFQKLPSFETIELSPNKLDVLGYLIDKANGWIAYYEAENNNQYLQNALQTFILADKLIDIIYIESREDLSKLFWRKKSATFYPKAVEVCYLLKEPSKAFFFMEKNKAMLLLENMTDASAKRISKLPEHVLEREQELIKNIKTLASEIQSYNQNQAHKIDILKNKLFHYKKEYNGFLDSLEFHYPKYYNYKKNINIISLEEAQSNLQSEEMILQYIIGKEKGFVGLITSKNSIIKELNDINKLTQLINQYRNAVSQPFLNIKDKEVYEQLAQNLYQQLIPFETIHKFQQKRITIIADGLLQYIPFEALLTKNKEYVIKDTEINYNYSLSSAAQARKNVVKIDKEFIAIAPTRFKENQYEKLATSTDELQKLSRIFNADYFQFDQATKDRFSKAYGHYKIIHLSTHGGIDNTIPWVAFYDEKMTLDELYFTKDQSELVVLSACKTSDGELKKGEGVMSLARGFFNAGAKSVVSSLWDINEKASNEIIQEFYKNLEKGHSKSAALQKAKWAYIKNHEYTSEASPYYWSALTITGETAPIYKGNTKFLLYLLGSVFLSGAALLFYLKKKRKTT